MGISWSRDGIAPKTMVALAIAGEKTDYAGRCPPVAGFVRPADARGVRQEIRPARGSLARRPEPRQLSPTRHSSRGRRGASPRARISLRRSPAPDSIGNLRTGRFTATCRTPATCRTWRTRGRGCFGDWTPPCSAPCTLPLSGWDQPRLGEVEHRKRPGELGGHDLVRRRASRW